MSGFQEWFSVAAKDSYIIQTFLWPDNHNLS